MRRFVFQLGIAGLLVAGCESVSSTSPEPGQPTIDAQLRQTLRGWGIVPIGAMPAQDPALVELGRALFFDKELSGNRDIACATCHHPTTALGDGRSLPVGTGGSGVTATRTLGPGRDFVPRSAPSLLNSGLGMFYLFWDGRLSGFGTGTFTAEGGPALPPGLANALVAQAMLPVVNRAEMLGNPGDTDVFGNTNELARFEAGQETEVWQGIMKRLVAIPEYVIMFAAAFPGRPASALRFEDAAHALAVFQRDAFTKANSAFDRYLEQDDAALSGPQKQGALLFFGKARCSNCHNGPFLGANGFANVGAPQIGPGVGQHRPLDLGRGEIQNHDFYRFAFRVAPLRNVELTAPYMHSGAYSTLEAVVRHYNNVPDALRTYDVNQHAPALRDSYHGDQATISSVLANLDGRLQTPLNLTEDEMHQLVAFLRSLTDPAARQLASIAPVSVPSGLPVN